MALRPCLEPGCPTLSNDTRCPAHTRAKDKARGSSTVRGYDYTHQLERESWRPAVERGGLPCRRCRKPLVPTEPWDLGHPDAHCDRPTAPECQPCNRATRGR